MTAIPIALLLTLVCSAADFVDFVDGSRRQHGLTVAETDEFIEFQQSDQVNRKLIRTRFAKEQIRSHIKTIDQSRLEKLQPGHWIDYRDYAEELASVKTDPIARETAIRLFAICLAYGGPRIRKSAATNLPLLAENEDEKRNFGILAFLYGNGKEIPITPKEELSKQARIEILQLVRLLRRERFDKASGLLSAPEMQSNLSNTPLLQLDQLNAAIAKRKITNDLRIKLLRVESKFGSGRLSTTSNSPRPSLIEPFDQTPVGKRMPLSFDDVFDFDLQATRFAAGKWIRP